MRDEAEVDKAAGTQKDRGVSQRTLKASEDVQEELEATQQELQRAYDTIENLTASVSFLRRRAASGSARA